MSACIQKHIELMAPVSRVWRALTDHREFGDWFRVKIDGPFVVGELSTGHMTYPGYEHVQWHAIIEKMERERFFAFRWPHPADYHETDYSNAPFTLVEFTLEPIEGGTRLTVVDSGFENIPADRRDNHFRQNDGGWSQQMNNIETHVAAN